MVRCLSRKRGINQSREILLMKRRASKVMITNSQSKTFGYQVGVGKKVLERWKSLKRTM